MEVGDVDEDFGEFRRPLQYVFETQGHRIPDQTESKDFEVGK